MQIKPKQPPGQHHQESYTSKQNYSLSCSSCRDEELIQQLRHYCLSFPQATLLPMIFWRFFKPNYIQKCSFATTVAIIKTILRAYSKEVVVLKCCSTCFECTRSQINSQTGLEINPDLLLKLQRATINMCRK